MNLILNISKKLSEKNVFHKTENNWILTRRSKIKIPNLNEDIAYLIGVIAGDGSLISTKRNRGGNHYMIRIYANSKIYLNYLNKIIKNHFSITGKIIKDKRKKNTFFIVIQNASIFWFFKILESKYNPTNKLPPICKNKLYFNNYLAGLIDTDGSISNKRIQLKLKNQKIIKKIFSKIKEANPNPPKINYTNNIPFYYIRFDNIFPLRWKGTNFLN